MLRPDENLQSPVLVNSVRRCQTIAMRLKRDVNEQNQSQYKTMTLFLLCCAMSPAPNANAKIAKPTSKSARKRVANAVHQIGKATRTATTKTITVHATGMVGDIKGAQHPRIYLHVQLWYDHRAIRSCGDYRSVLPRKIAVLPYTIRGLPRTRMTTGSSPPRRWMSRHDP